MSRPRKLDPFVCKHHGKLPPELFHNQGGKKAGKDYYICKLCRREWSKKDFHKRGRSHCPKKGEEGYEEWKAYSLEKQKEARKNLTDGAIRDAIYKSIGLKCGEIIRSKGISKENITDEMIEIYRVIMKIKRKKKSSEQL